MKLNRPILLRTLGVAHILVAVILFPANLFLSIFSIPIVIPAQIWLSILGARLWRPDKKLQAPLRYTNYVLAPFSILLIIFGIGALHGAKLSAEAGGGLLGSFGLIPLAMGISSGILFLVSLYVIHSGVLEKTRETAREAT